MPMCPVPWPAVHLCTAVVPAVSGLSLSITYSRHLAWQFSDPLSTHQNKVHHEIKKSQDMDLAWNLTQLQGIERTSFGLLPLECARMFLGYCSNLRWQYGRTI